MERAIVPMFCDLCGSEIRDREKCLIVQPCVAAESFGGEISPYGRLHGDVDPCVCSTCAGEDLAMLLDRYIKRVEKVRSEQAAACPCSADGVHRWKHLQSGDSPNFFECYSCGLEVER
jgi:hypothetical protein